MFRKDKTPLSIYSIMNRPITLIVYSSFLQNILITSKINVKQTWNSNKKIL